MEIVSVDEKIIFPNLNISIVTASTRSLFCAINLFYKCGPQ